MHQALTRPSAGDVLHGVLRVHHTARPTTPTASSCRSVATRSRCCAAAMARSKPVGALGMLLGMIEPTLSTTVVDLDARRHAGVLHRRAHRRPRRRGGLGRGTGRAARGREVTNRSSNWPTRSAPSSASPRPQGSGDDTALLILRFERRGDVLRASRHRCRPMSPQTSGGTPVRPTV